MDHMQAQQRPGACKLQIVVPCYNEAAVLPEAARQFDALLDRLIQAGKIAAASQLMFVDDGSRDATWSLIEQEAQQQPRVVGLKLSRNQGHQNAVLAGLMGVMGACLGKIYGEVKARPRYIIEQMTGTPLPFPWSGTGQETSDRHGTQP